MLQGREINLLFLSPAPGIDPGSAGVRLQCFTHRHHVAMTAITIGITMVRQSVEINRNFSTSNFVITSVIYTVFMLQGQRIVFELSEFSN